MRLTDRCTIHSNGAQIGTPARCEFRHVSGQVLVDPSYTATAEVARVLVEPRDELARITNVSGWTVKHHGQEYRVTAVLPRYRTLGRLHHVSIDLKAVTL